MGSRSRSPVAAGPREIFTDLRAVADRVRDGLDREVPESDVEPPPEEAPGTEISRFAQEERARVLSAGARGLEKLAKGRDDEVGDDESFGIEAIVLLEGRPAILVQAADFAPQEGEWEVLNHHRAAIRDSVSRVGRVDVTGHVSLDWVGTGFLVGADVIMTNRHVAAEFTRGDGAAWTFQPGLSADLDLAREFGRLPGTGGPAYALTEVIGIHDEADMALLRVAPVPGGEPLPDPLAVAADAPADLPGHPVYVVGHPAWDGRRNEPESMRRIFMDIYNVKRLQPGAANRLLAEKNVMTHDCSTLGGNSGSPVFDLNDHRVLGLHFGGRYGFGNYAVPLWTMLEDPLVRRADLNFV
ncbi:trypsin-like peptidase domain-containing protein [Streptomyces sp. MUM 203J]|uniref:trypsin-like serine peptidase n=1 Tax=Streptomyces sp. MUM 203J TaxID=2791990 RepID=UPI001F04A5F3|nr:serine protease [Streptomyces sp. MUM 203J]MCH0538916.1 trypsin-like peptidase domain-containing protein [Streptomyces sp. MUM 203J]